MQITYKFLILTLLLLTSSMVSGQTGYAFQNLSKKDGLSQASVFAIEQDESGFMWFGTREGLNKYDGYHFKTYTSDLTDNSLVANDVRTLYFDQSTKQLWVGSTSGIGTSIGLNLQDGTTDDFERFYMDNSQDLSNPRNDVKAILEDGDGQMWFGTGDGLYKLRTDKNGSFIFERQSFDSDSRLSNVHVKNILEDPSGNFWIGTLERGLIYWNRSDGSIDSYANEYPNQSVHRVSQTNLSDHFSWTNEVAFG